MKKISVNFVCLGNICRSPLAEGIFRKIIRDHELEHLFKIYSSGTSNYHIGEPPDPRSIAIAKTNKIDISKHMGNQFDEKKEKYDYVLAMDKENYKTLKKKLSSSGTHLMLLSNYSETFTGKSIPDPYWSGPDGFVKVFNLIEEACIGFLSYLKNEHQF